MKAFVNRFNPEKLNLSKWTAVAPSNEQRHFIVTRLLRNHDKRIVQCELQAVLNRESMIIDCTELKDAERWIMGWK